MPKLRVNGAELHYEESGAGPETIVFSHGLLWSGRMFDAQVASLKGRFRVITYDHRGQGESEATADGYDMDTLAADAAELIQKLVRGPCHFAGLSMGGFVGMRLAIRRPELLKSLILMETSADPEPRENLPQYRLLNAIVRWFGFWPVVGRIMPIMFGDKFLRDAGRVGLRTEMRARLLANRRASIVRAVEGVLTREGMYEQLDRINLPTLIIVGDQDRATVPAKAERMHARIKGSKLVIVPGAGHTSSVEEPQAVNAALQDFLSRLV
jgi:3-oxoadipate enol-lactonase